MIAAEEAGLALADNPVAQGRFARTPRRPSDRLRNRRWSLKDLCQPNLYTPARSGSINASRAESWDGSEYGSKS